MDENTKECKCECSCSKKGFVYWFVIIVGVGFIVFASISLGNKISDNNCNCPKCDTEEKIKNASQDRYEFDFYDGGIPGNTIKGFIDLKNGNTKMVITKECSIPNTCEKVEDEVLETTLSSTELNKVIDYLEKYKYPNAKKVGEENFKADEKTVEFIYSLRTIILGSNNIKSGNEGLDNLLK